MGDTKPKSKINLVNYQAAQDQELVDSTIVPAAWETTDEITIQENVLPGEQLGQSTVETGALLVEQVIDSVAQCYPEIEVAIGEIEAAEGKILSSWGEFDSKFGAFSISQPLGFYQNYQNGTRNFPAALGWW